MTAGERGYGSRRLINLGVLELLDMTWIMANLDASLRTRDSTMITQIPRAFALDMRRLFDEIRP